MVFSLPKKYTIEMTEDAFGDLDRIFNFYFEVSESAQVAARQAMLLGAEVGKLDIFPKGYPSYKNNPIYRLKHFKKFIIVFKIDDSARMVSIVRILHSRQNLKKELNG